MLLVSLMAVSGDAGGLPGKPSVSHDLPAAATRPFPGGPRRVYAGGMADAISYGDFDKVDIRVGTIVDAQPFPEARKPAIKLWVDFGAPLGVRRSSAQITVHYPCDRLIGRQVLAVVNFPPRQIGPFLSEVLTLGFPDDRGEVVLIGPERKVPDGGRLF